MKKTLQFLFAFIMAIPFANAQLKPVSYQDGNQKLSGFAINRKPQLRKKQEYWFYRPGRV